MALAQEVVLDLNKKRTVNPKITLRQSDANYPSIEVTITENGEAFNATGWNAAFEGMTPSGLYFIHDSDHFTSSDPVRGKFTYTPPLQISSEIGTYALSYFVFEKDDTETGGPVRRRTTTADFKLVITEQADINKPAADDYVSQWQAADVIARSYAADMDAAAQKFYDHVNEHQDALDVRINDANASLQTVLGSNNTYTGNNTFNGTSTFAGAASMESLTVSQPILGSIATRVATFTDFNTVAAAMETYQGEWAIASTAVANGPAGNLTDAYVKIAKGTGVDNGVIEVTKFHDELSYTGYVSAGAITWVQVADTIHSVQTTGDQTVGGNKTFTEEIQTPGFVLGGNTHITSGVIDVKASDIVVNGDAVGEVIPTKVLNQKVLNATTINFNTQLTSGEYLIPSATNLQNGPVGVTSPFIGVLNVTGGVAFVTQTLYDTTTGHQFVRTAIGTKFTPWRDLLSGAAGGVVNWQPNMDVLKNQLVRVGSLGNPRTGKITNGIFRSIIDQNTGTTFPAADTVTGVGGKWELTNKDAYTYDVGGVAFPYGFTMILTRIGNIIFPYPNGAFTSPVPSNSRFFKAKETVPLGLRIINRLSVNSGVSIPVTDEDGGDGVTFIINNNGQIFITSLTGFPANNYLRGPSTPYETGDAMIWAAGVPLN